MTVTSHDIYIKLTVSSLNYSHNGHARIILNKALTAISEVGSNISMACSHPSTGSMGYLYCIVGRNKSPLEGIYAVVESGWYNMSVCH